MLGFSPAVPAATEPDFDVPTASSVTTQAGALWRASVLRLLENSADAIADEKISIAERIHAARRAAKEGRALLKLAPGPMRAAARTARGKLREIRREMGPARDARVALSLIEDHFRRNPNGSEHIAEMLASLGRRCQVEEAALSSQAVASIAERLRAIAQTIRDVQDDASSDAEIVDRAVRFYRDARRLLPDPGKRPSEMQLHGLRSAIVDHRYQMDLLAALDGRKSEKRVKDLQKLRSDLGDYLDMAHVESILHAQPTLDRAMDLKPLRRGQTRRLSKALANARSLFAEKPKDFRAVLAFAAPVRD